VIFLVSEASGAHWTLVVPIGLLEDATRGKCVDSEYSCERESVTYVLGKRSIILQLMFAKKGAIPNLI
jgi:hypothetical protein